jgi:hypothetical protein
MINRMQTGVQTGARSHNYSHQRVKLAIAMYDVEVAYVRLAGVEPGDPKYSYRSEQLKVALQQYWNIDGQIESYIQRARGN